MDYIKFNWTFCMMEHYIRRRPRKVQSVFLLGIWWLYLVWLCCFDARQSTERVGKRFSLQADVAPRVCWCCSCHAEHGLPPVLLPCFCGSCEGMNFWHGHHGAERLEEDNRAQQKRRHLNWNSAQLWETATKAPPSALVFERPEAAVIRAGNLILFGWKLYRLM